MRIYEGAEGIRTVLYDTLKCRSKRLLGILSMRDLLDVPGRAETEAYIRQRIRHGIFLRVLRSREKDVGDIWQSGAAELREVRYAPTGLVFTMTTWIYDDKVAIVSSRRENFGMTIESEEFAQMQQNLFSVLWTVSEPDRREPGPAKILGRPDPRRPPGGWRHAETARRYLRSGRRSAQRQSKQWNGGCGRVRTCDPRGVNTVLFR